MPDVEEIDYYASIAGGNSVIGARAVPISLFANYTDTEWNR